LERLVFSLRSDCNGGNDFRAESGVDPRAIAEVFLAVSAGLGVLGRNGLLRTPQHGSRVFIGVLFTDLELPEVRWQADLLPECAACARCTPACPTGALGNDGLVRLDRCRSFLTLEFKGAFSVEQAALLGDCLFGCDGCTAPCPPAPPACDRISVDLDWLLKADDAEIANRIRGSALEHTGPERLRRNAAACCGVR
jgi:epoxyqueuosine reductase